MFSFVKRMFARRAEQTHSITEPSPEDRFEMLMVAVDVLNEFSREICRCTLPEVPDNIASVRGWTIRYESLPDYYGDLPPTRVRLLAERLYQPINILAAYLRRWEEQVFEVDSVVRPYQFMPGETDSVDSVRIILDRAQCLQFVEEEISNPTKGEEGGEANKRIAH